MTITSAIPRQVLTRLPSIAISGPVEWSPSNFISGPKHLPIQFGV